ncbi:MAG TPA: hypothetical protein VJ911_08570 [Cryomorphaceae bacterium]|nr:hypothetical protein [Cryomorphaceae bacterium]
MANVVYKNFETHHKQRSFVVFYFYAKDPADYFEALLIENDIPYERGSGKDLMRRHLIGIHKSHQAKAEELNNETGNFFRKPFLGNQQTKYAVLIFTLGAIIIALIGYLVKN